MDDKTVIIGNAEASLAIFDTELDKFVTSTWPVNFLHRILSLWQARHPDMNMTRFEFRPRRYDVKPEDQQAILVVDKTSQHVVAFYHMENKGYTNAYDPENYFFVKYTPPEGLDITDIMGRFDMKPWDGKGEIIHEL